LINQANIGEWLREVKERSESAPLIIREIANRLIELDKLNEQLRAENLALSTKHRVQQYKDRIAELEYQLEIMGKQLENGPANLEAVNLLVYNWRGQVIRLAVNAADLVSGATIGSFSGEFVVEKDKIGLCSVHPREELLLVFASGRSTRLPVDNIPLSQSKELNWDEAYDENLSQGEASHSEGLVCITPISRLSMFDQAVQISRRGYARKISRKFFQRYISRNNIGQGIDRSVQVDRPLNLTLCNQADLFVIVSRQGYVMSVTGDSLPAAADQAIRLDPDDSVVASFALTEGTSLVIVTQEGRAIRYPAGWLKPADKLGRKGQAIWSKAKRESGIQVTGALAAANDDWGVGLKGNGQLVTVKINEIPLSKSSKVEHLLKNIYPFDLVAFTWCGFNNH
jgi:DNA gyrase/topoisomerase IV subunit A